MRRALGPKKGSRSGTGATPLWLSPHSHLLFQRRVGTQIAHVDGAPQPHAPSRRLIRLRRVAAARLLLTGLVPSAGNPASEPVTGQRGEGEHEIP